MKHNLPALFIFAILLLATACSTTELLSSWKAKDARLEKYNKVLVVGLTGTKDRELRESIETSMVSALRSNGITAEAASENYGPKAFEKLTDEQVVGKVKSGGYDGIIIIALLDKAKEKYYTPGRVSYTPYYTYYSRYWRQWRTIYDRVYEPGYYTNTTNFTLEANLYNVNQDVLEYSAQAKSFDPGNAQTLSSGFTKTVVQDMIKKGIVSKS